MLIEYIPNANKYTTYKIAEELEANPQMWVDSLSDDHIEVHSDIEIYSNKNGEMFCEELTEFINKHFEFIKFEMKNEILIINGKRCKVPYAVLDMKTVKLN